MKKYRLFITFLTLINISIAQEKLEIDFKNEFELASEKLSYANTNYPELRKERINRCIVLIANGSIDKLDRAIEIAKADWRDAILNAEYEYLKGESPKPIYDLRFGFNKI